MLSEVWGTDVARIEVRNRELAVWLKAAGAKHQEGDADQAAAVDRVPCLRIPWTKPPPKRFKEILLPAAIERHRVRPIKFERRAALLKSIARARAWLDEIVAGTTTVEQIAVRQKCSVRHVNMTTSLAFIAPDLVKAAIEGRLPRGVGIAALRDAPAEWSLQFRRLGLAPGLILTRMTGKRRPAVHGPTAPRRSCRGHSFSAPGTEIFGAETEARNAPSARSGDWEGTSAH